MQRVNNNDVLEQLIRQSCEIVENIKADLTFGLTVANEYHYDLFDVLISEFKTMESVLVLTEHEKFNDSFILIRSILEMLLFFWLMVDGKLYRWQMIYNVEPKENMTAEERTKEIVQKWKDKKKQGDKDYENIIEIQELKRKDAFLVVYRLEGLFDEKDKERKEQFIPFYYFLLTDHYNPSLLNEQKESIRAVDPFPEKRDEHISAQKILYRRYIRFESILDNLELNNLITKNQKEYLEIHYNFLSQFTHPSKESVWGFTGSFSQKIYRDVPDEVIKEQIFLYLARFQLKFLQIIIEKFKRENTSARIVQYQQLTIKLRIASTHFWFFDNNPTAYDKWKSDGMKGIYRLMQKKEPPDIISYYENPITRLHELKNWRN